MAVTRPDSRQVINRAALSQIGAAAGTTQDSLNSKVSIELDSPLRLSASFPTADAKLNFANSLLTAADGGNKVLPPVSSQVFESLTGAFINFQTQALSNASHFTITWPVTNNVGQFRRAGFTLTSAGKIQVLFSAEAASEGALANAGTLFVQGVPLGYINLVCTNASGFFKTAGSATNIIENAKIYRFGAGGAGSGGSGSGVGDDLNSLAFRASFSDDFTDTPTASTAAVDTTRTNATYDAVAAAYRMSYDATRTITGTGTAMTLSGAPAFTVAAGDVVVNLSTLEVRRIASISSQTSYTLEAAFAADPTAVAVCVSQAVHTTDVRAHTENSTGLAISAEISDPVVTYILRYRDSAAASDAIWDMPGTALAAFSVSADNTNWSVSQTRVTSLSTTEAIRSVPVSGSQFKARFYSNATSGSGAVNVLDWKVFMHADSQAVSGNFAAKALARTDGAGTPSNASVSVASGATRVTTTFTFGTEVLVYLDGKKIPEFVDAITTPDASFTRIGGNVIQLDQDYSSVALQVEILVPANTVDNTNVNATNISAIQDMYVAGLQPFVDESAKLTPVSGAPVGQQFRTFGIVGRASIPDIANDLRAHYGVNRVMIQRAVELPTEFGANNERVFGSMNDTRNLYRFVGAWTQNTDTGGSYTQATLTTDFMEVVFFGTGLNLLSTEFTAAPDARVTIDGGSEGGNIFGTYSTAMQARNYATNNSLNIASNLTLGIHTVKIRNNATGTNGLGVYGIEILNQSANINVRPGVSYASGKKLILSAEQNISPTSTFETVTQAGSSVAFSATRGARVIVYQKADGTIAKAAYLTNSSQQNLTAADHTYEQPIRTFHPREFGVGLSTDFSILTGAAASTRAFTLDDGITTLAANARVNQFVAGQPEGLNIDSGGSTEPITLTFVGTGLDAVYAHDANSPTDVYTFVVDGTSIGTFTPTVASEVKMVKIVSGLPYGTHTVRITKNAVAPDMGFVRFITYGPKKPTLPTGATEIADYYVMATYAANSTAGLGTIATGTLRKMMTREMALSGTWVVQGLDITNYNSGWDIDTAVNGSKLTFTFYGTGVEVRLPVVSTFNVNQTFAIDGSTNLSGYTTNYYSGATGITFTAAAGTLIGTPSGTSVASGLQISNLPLGVHTLTITYNLNSRQFIDCIDVITPIHAPKTNIPGDLQNTLLIGSCALSDSRKMSPIRSEDPKKIRAVAVDVGTSVSTSSSVMVPMPDMSVTIDSPGDWFEFMFQGCFQPNGAVADQIESQFYVDGNPVGKRTYVRPNSSTVAFIEATQTHLTFIPAGVHKIDVYWQCDGTAVTVLGGQQGRQLTVKQL